MNKLDKIDRMLITHDQLAQVFKAWLEEWAADPSKFGDINKADDSWPEAAAKTFERILMKIIRTNSEVRKFINKEYPLTEKDERIIAHARRTGTPIFVLTAKDDAVLDTLNNYYWICSDLDCSQLHLAGIRSRIEEFTTWKTDHKDQVKIPD